MTQENLQAENAELKRKLAEAEKADEQKAAILHGWPQNFRCSHAFFPVGFEDGSWHCGECWAEAEERRANFSEDKVVDLMARAEAAERERDEWKRRAGEASDYGASMLSAAMARTDERDEARRKCAAMSEALQRARAFVGGLRGSQFTSDSQHGEAFGVIHAIAAALASQPAPEAKPCQDCLGPEVKTCPGCGKCQEHCTRDWKPTPEAP
jgi:hypothetical protein